MWWVIALVVIALAGCALVLARRGSRGVSGDPDAGRPAESFRLPGGGGGNNGGWGAGG